MYRNRTEIPGSQAGESGNGVFSYYPLVTLCTNIDATFITP